MTRRNYFNLPTSTQLPMGAPKDAVKADFATRLQQQLIQKGWNQTELARRAQEYLTNGARLGRDNISQYIRGVVLPAPANLEAIAKALNVKVVDLLPQRGVPSAGDRTSQREVRDLGDGNAWVRINQAVPWPVALKVLTLLDEGDDRSAR